MMDNLLHQRLGPVGADSSGADAKKASSTSLPKRNSLDGEDHRASKEPKKARLSLKKFYSFQKRKKDHAII